MEQRHRHPQNLNGRYATDLFYGKNAESAGRPAPQPYALTYGNGQARPIVAARVSVPTGLQAPGPQGQNVGTLRNDTVPSDWVVLSEEGREQPNGSSLFESSHAVASVTRPRPSRDSAGPVYPQSMLTVLDALFPTVSNG